MSGIYSYKNVSFLEKECIVWQENSFITSSCARKNTIDNSIYNLNINQFKKIEINSNTPFFKNGNPSVWYGKSSSKKIEFFTQRGVHPETLKELHPITDYIIDKYVDTNIVSK